MRTLHGEVALLRVCGGPVSIGYPPRFPGRKSAIKNDDVLVAHGAERPPYARRGEDAVVVVDDNTRAIADPKLAHAGGEFLRRGQHVRQAAVGVGDVVDVEEDGAWDAALVV